MSECLFCKIINKEIPSQIIYEDENYLGFLDINPNTEGHALVVPKKHVDNFTNLTNQEAGDLLMAVHKIAPKLAKILGTETYYVALNNGKVVVSEDGQVAGQLIDHVHWHIVPRYQNDGLMHWPINDQAKEKLDETFQKLQNKIN